MPAAASQMHERIPRRLNRVQAGLHWVLGYDEYCGKYLYLSVSQIANGRLDSK
jgi:hypothetical protein